MSVQTLKGQLSITIRTNFGAIDAYTTVVYLAYLRSHVRAVRRHLLTVMGFGLVEDIHPCAGRQKQIRGGATRA